MRGMSENPCTVLLPTAVIYTISNQCAGKIMWLYDLERKKTNSNVFFFIEFSHKNIFFYFCTKVKYTFDSNHIIEMPLKQQFNHRQMCLKRTLLRSNYCTDWTGKTWKTVNHISRYRYRTTGNVFFSNKLKEKPEVYDIFFEKVKASCFLIYKFLTSLVHHSTSVQRQKEIKNILKFLNENKGIGYILINAKNYFWT